MDPIESNRLVGLPEVIRLSGMSRSTIYKYMEEGTFPKPKRVGGKMIVWKTRFSQKTALLKASPNNG